MKGQAAFTHFFVFILSLQNAQMLLETAKNSSQMARTYNMTFVLTVTKLFA